MLGIKVPRPLLCFRPRSCCLERVCLNGRRPFPELCCPTKVFSIPPEKYNDSPGERGGRKREEREKKREQKKEKEQERGERIREKEENERKRRKKEENEREKENERKKKRVHARTWVRCLMLILF